MRTKTRQRYRAIVQDDLEIMPLMNLFVAMIPMLLISAVFLNVTVIDMKAPPDSTDPQTQTEPREPLSLAVTIRTAHYVVEGRGISKRVIAREDSDARDQLAAALTEIAGARPDNQDVMIISEPRTHYGDIITVMDVSRESGLPGVSLLGSN